MMSEVLSYLIMITCILIRVSSKEVKWTVRDTPPKLGQDLTLFCKVDNCTLRETKRWHGGPDDKVLMLNSGISTDKTKYSTSIEKNGFILTILNLTVKDLNISYSCSCGLELDDHILYIEDVYTVDNLNKTTNGTNYIGTNDVGGISLYVYIVIPVILVILLIIVIVVSKGHWWSRGPNENIDGTGGSNTDRFGNPSVIAPFLEAARLDPNPGNMNLPPGSYSQPSSSPLKSVEDIPRPHSEKTNKLHSCSSKRDNSNDTSALLQTIERLKDEKRKLEEIVERYKSHQTDNTGPCHTDTQKQVKKLQEEIDDLKQKNHQMSNLLIEKQLQVHSLEVQYQNLEPESEAALQAAADDKEKTVADVRETMKSSTHNLQSQYEYDVMYQKVVVLESLYSNLTDSVMLIGKRKKQLPKLPIKTITDVTKQTTEAIDEYNRKLQEIHIKELYLRKKCHNDLVELKGNIRVFCRVRPKITEDDGPMACNVVKCDKDNDGIIVVSNKGRTQKFVLDKVFTQRSLQKEVFDEVKALVTSCIDGYNVCIFAYGQTGSGKTFTMEGPPLDPGINTRALKELFNEISAKGDDWSFTIEVSFLEIYTEIIRDLLSDHPSKKMEVKMKPDKSLYVPGLSLLGVKKVEEVIKIFTVGQRNRATATTNMNENSSRSHALLCVTVTGFNKTTKIKTMGKLNLVDLAGSERVSKSGAEGKKFEEATHINQSLSSLGNVINALRSKQKFVPYRYSKLTRILQDSLSGDSKILMIVQVAPVEKNVTETICSLNFAQHVRTVELGQASKKISQEM